MFTKHYHEKLTSSEEFLGFLENVANKLISYKKNSDHHLSMLEEQDETKYEEIEPSGNPYASAFSTNKLLLSNKVDDIEGFDLQVKISDFNNTNNRLLDLTKFRKRNKDIFDDETQASFGVSLPKSILNKGTSSILKTGSKEKSKTPGATQTGFNSVNHQKSYHIF